MMDRVLYGVSFLSSLMEHRLGGPMYYYYYFFDHECLLFQRLPLCHYYSTEYILGNTAIIKPLMSLITSEPMVQGLFARIAIASVFRYSWKLF